MIKRYKTTLPASSRFLLTRPCRTLWPDSADPQAKNSLRQVLSSLRKALNVDDVSVLDADTRDVWINDPGRYIDVTHFHELANSKELRDLELAANLFQGELLDGFVVLPDLEGWLRDKRSDILREAAALAEALSHQKGSYQKATVSACLDLSRRLLAIDPTVEAAHRAIIRVHQKAGNTTEGGVRQIRTSLY